MTLNFINHVTVYLTNVDYTNQVTNMSKAFDTQRQSIREVYVYVCIHSR